VNYHGVAEWGDYDSDGDLDLALMGLSSSRQTRIYRNDGSDTFTELAVGLGGGADGDMAWGDFDNDGDLDLLYSGLQCGTQIFRNDGSDCFSAYPNAFRDVANSIVSWGDYDGDGRLDALVAGDADGRSTELWRNVAAAESANTMPSAPSGLNGAVPPQGGTATLSWSAASDSETVSSNLTYNLRIGTSSGVGDVVSPMAHATTGLRRVPASGNVGHRLSWTLNSLTPGSNYWWSVQAIDAALAGGAWANESTFSVPSTPTVETFAVSNIVVSSAQCGGTVIAEGGIPVTARGLVWHTSPDPSVGTYSGITTNGAGVGSFDATMAGLAGGTVYYVRAYGTSTAGTGYGTERDFVTSMVPPGNSLKLDGYNDYAECGSTIDLSNTAFTVEFWAQRDTSGGWDLAVAQGEATDYHGLHIGWRDS
ncbi:MAG: VCBS repeat-containing protein, partial [Lentisphaeria bacterium]|nr:VCBS repeat-containing protein [Lentisphaeria bacterium]